MEKSKEEHFLSRYSKLNADQKLAVDTIEGPVMVIAGPGTGKTETLALRVANILYKTDTFPSNILCLTYTDQASINMRERLLSIIGSDADKVHIHTFHSFCNLVIQENKDVFNLDTEAEVIDNIERKQILKDILLELPNDNPLQIYFSADYMKTPINELGAVIEWIEKENLDIEKSKNMIDEYIKSLPEREEFIYKRKSKNYHAGDVKQSKVDEETKRMNKLKARMDLYTPYKNELRRRQRYTYQDMVIGVIEKFKENPNILANYQERFLHFLVDEYQDTNGSQNNILYQLVDFWEKPNVFVVGDDDQSIFRFQGANTGNMIHFYNKYAQDITPIVLNTNYRSTQHIVDASANIISPCVSRLGNQLEFIDKTIKSGVDHTGTDIRIHEFENKHLEIAWIANTINNLKNNNVSLENIAVLFRNNTFGNELIPYLNYYNIPFQLSKEDNILESVFIDHFIILFRYFNKEIEKPFSSHSELFKILHFDYFGIEPHEIHILVAEIAKKNKTYHLRKHIQDMSEQKAPSLFSISDKGKDKIIHIYRLLEQLMADYYNLSFLDWFFKILHDLNILSTILSKKNKQENFEHLNVFFHFITKECLKNPSFKLSELLDLLREYKSNNEPIRANRIFKMEEGVQLLTMHSSKGLEFEHVFLMHLTKKNFEDSGKRSFKIPDSFKQSKGNTEEENEENNRLFYVGLTRAKRFVYLSYFKQSDENSKVSEPSTFVNMLKDSGIKTELHSNTDDKNTFDLLASTYQFSIKETLSNKTDFIHSIDDLLANFSLNATALNNFIACPLNFYYSNILRIPQAPNSSLSYGNAIHETLTDFFNKVKHNKWASETPSLEEVLLCFNNEINKNAWVFNDKELKNRKEQGKEELHYLYRVYMTTAQRNIENEYAIYKVHLNDIRLRGRLDKIEYLDEPNNIKIVDYKTGKYDKAKDKLSPPNPNRKGLEYGGDYWRQAMFYILLIEHFQRKSWRVNEVEFIFSDPNKDSPKDYHKHIITPAPSQLNTMKQTIAEVWDKIQSKNYFENYCDNEYCEYCDFYKKFGIK